MPQKPHVPAYRLHKATGQAVVTVDGCDYYLGKHGSAESKAAYARIIAERAAGVVKLSEAPAKATDLTVAELICHYWGHAECWYMKDGKPTSQLELIRRSMIPVRRLYGDTPASGFGPSALRAVRQTFVDAGYVRTSINAHVCRVRRMFRWGVAQELIPPSVLHGLEAVDGLRLGRCSSPESEPVRPVSDSDIRATIRFLSRPLAAAVQVQRLTGMRAGELLAMRPMDIDMTGKLWLYKPISHKTQHHGHERVVEIGPKAQNIIKPLLAARATEAFIFDPRDAERELRERRQRERTTRLSCGNRPGTNRVENPKRKPGERYTPLSYASAVRKACLKADVPIWRPHQLRHSFATDVRKRYGLEAARVLCGHKSIVVTQVYAEEDREKAARVALKIG